MHEESYLDGFQAVGLLKAEHSFFALFRFDS